MYIFKCGFEFHSKETFPIAEYGASVGEQSWHPV